jgi:hypothetical protein
MRAAGRKKGQAQSDAHPLESFDGFVSSSDSHRRHLSHHTTRTVHAVSK